MKLPGENELREHIRLELASDLQVTSDLLAIGMSIFEPNTRLNPKIDMDHAEAWMCLGIVMKACYQYRAIVALSEIALGDVADSNGRMLSETMLAALFLMRPVVTLKRNGVALPDIPGYPLTPAFRTKLYLAHDALSGLKSLRGMVGCGNMSKEDADRAVALAEQHVAENALEVGAEWLERLKKTGTFSGIKIVDLAESLGMSFLYHTFYRPSSAGVHGTNARKFIDPEVQSDGSITFHANLSPRGVAEALIFSSLMMFEVLDVTNQRFGLGLDERLGKLAPRIQNMTKRLPAE